MKFCPECGTAVSGGKFCSECGYRLQGEVTPSASAVTPPRVGLGLDLPDLSSFDALGNMANNCVSQDLAQQEAEALAAFEVEKHQNGKYAILALKDKSEMDVVVPNGVEAIGPGAFEGSDVLTVVLPEGLRKIGDRAFADCEDLESINFPKSLRVIGNEAFSGCANLDAEAPEGVRIGENAFPDTDPDTGSSDRVQFLLDKISGMMAEAEALFDDNEEEDRVRREEQEAREREAESWYRKAQDYEKNNYRTSAYDFEEHARLFRKAAELGHAEAQYNLAMLYGLGMGVKEDKREAVKWYREAAEQGHAGSQYFLAQSYYWGDGVECNNDEAVKWCRKAAEQGDADAQEMMYEMYSRGEHTKISRSEAVEWLHKAAEQGGWKAQATLGRYYWNEDLDKAEYWLSEALRNGANYVKNELDLIKEKKKGR